MGSSGANFIDVMFTVQACEQKGIKTVLLNPEWGSADGAELPLVYYAPEATAMVSTGSTDQEFKLPAPAKVIGVGKNDLIILHQGDQPFSPWNERTLAASRITYACDWWGARDATRIAY